jgi:hypothetical protein
MSHKESKDGKSVDDPHDAHPEVPETGQRSVLSNMNRALSSLAQTNLHRVVLFMPLPAPLLTSHLFSI